MSDRVVAVLVRASAGLPGALVDVMLTDVIDLVTDAENIDAAIALAEGYDVTALLPAWDGLDLVRVSADPSLAEVLQEVETTDSTAVAVVVADAPDLPVLLLGKLFSAIAGPRGASVAVCPAAGGGLVAAAAMVPISGWLRQLSVRFDDRDALDVLHASAPLTELSVGPGWHRVRDHADLALLDPGLEGWDATRAYLASL